MQKLRLIYASFRRLTNFTQIWMMLFLGPTILLSLFAASGPLGPWVTLLALLGFAPAPYLIWKQNGFSKLLALGHLLFWPPLLILIGYFYVNNPFQGIVSDYIYIITFIVLGVSVCFDIRELNAWMKGERAPT